MAELLQRSQIKRAQELDAVVDGVGVEAILRHERNGLAIGAEELGLTFTHLLAVLHAHVHGLRGVQHFMKAGPFCWPELWPGSASEISNRSLKSPPSAW